MLNLRKILLASAFALGLGSAAHAQQAVQQAPTQLTAGTICQTITTPAVNTQNTLTFPAVTGNSLYLTYLFLDSAQDATGGAVSNVTFTTTNLSNNPSFAFSQASAASSTLVVVNSSINPPIKSAASASATTIVSPSAATHTAFGMTACGYYAP